MIKGALKETCQSNDQVYISYISWTSTEMVNLLGTRCFMSFLETQVMIFFPQDKNQCILHSQYHDCWWVDTKFFRISAIVLTHCGLCGDKDQGPVSI